jgi:transposase
VELILHGLGTALMSNFRAIDRETGFLLPPSVDEWLPEKHLARFVVEVIDGLDLSAMVRSYRGSGSACYHPALLLGVLVSKLLPRFPSCPKVVATRPRGTEFLAKIPAG